MQKLKDFCKKTGREEKEVTDTAVKHYIDARTFFAIELKDEEIKYICDKHYGFDTMMQGKKGKRPIYRHINRYILLKHKYINDYYKVAQKMDCNQGTVYHSEKVILNMLDTDVLFRKKFYELIEKLKDANNRRTH